MNGIGIILKNQTLENIMVTFTHKSIAALTLGAFLLGSTGAIAIAQSSDNDGARSQKASWSGKHHNKRHGKKWAGKRQGGMKQMLRAADANNDGSLTKEEIDTYRNAQVTAADVNTDGDITIAEFETIWLAQTKRRMVRAFQRLDTDGDGMITKAERDAPIERMVKRMDRNGDGVINKDDRRKRGERRNHNKRDDG